MYHHCTYNAYMIGMKYSGIIKSKNVYRTIHTSSCRPFIVFSIRVNGTIVRDNGNCEDTVCTVHVKWKAEAHHSVIFFDVIWVQHFIIPKNSGSVTQGHDIHISHEAPIKTPHV